jgi:hypothetical protein
MGDHTFYIFMTSVKQEIKNLSISNSKQMTKIQQGL